MPESKEPQKYEILPPADTFVWRYMSLAKLLALFRSRALYLSRADQFDDPFEGSFSEGSLRDQEKDWGLASPESLVTMTQWLPYRSFVSCWHASNDESMALWRIYAGSEGALAIRSRVGVLQTIFPEITEPTGDMILNQAVRSVQYIDYRTEHPHLNDVMGPLCYKRRAFAYEQEIRVIRQEIPTGPAKDRPGGRAIQLGPPPEQKGIQIPIDLMTLIESIWLAPLSPPWLVDVVTETMRRFDLGDIPCRQSSLDELPDFGRLIFK
jgi:hypothetical protein